MTLLSLSAAPSRRTLLRGALGAGAALATAGWAWRQRPAAAPFDPSSEVCVVAPLQAWSAGSGLALAAPRPLPADARCPVCGMWPARRPEWAAQAIFEDGATQFLDSPLSLLSYLRELPRHVRGRPADTLVALHVTDSAAGPGHWLAAAQAWYVLGSDARGPMRGPNLPAWASRDAAQAFSLRHGGVLRRWDELQAHPGDWLADARHHHV